MYTTFYMYIVQYRIYMLSMNVWTCSLCCVCVNRCWWCWSLRFCYCWCAYLCVCLCSFFGYATLHTLELVNALIQHCQPTVPAPQTHTRARTQTQILLHEFDFVHIIENNNCIVCAMRQNIECAF